MQLHTEMIRYEDMAYLAALTPMPGVKLMQAGARAGRPAGPAGAALVWGMGRWAAAAVRRRGLRAEEGG